MLNVDETLLSKVINGYREPNGELRQRIAELLAADEHWLFERSRDVEHDGPNRPLNQA